MFELHDRVALVTGGGGSGIGAAICRILAISGARVHVSDRNPSAAEEAAREIRDSGGDAQPIILDVTDHEACVVAADKIVATDGQLDILVAAAGYTEIHPFVDEDPTYWNQIVGINFSGTIHACFAAFRHMIEAGSGRIVTISSDAGRIGTPGEAVYAGAKAGVVGFTKSLAYEGARHGVLVNSVCPGITETPLMRAQNQEHIQRMLRRVPLRRYADPSEIAAAVAFLASDEARTYAKRKSATLET